MDRKSFCNVLVIPQENREMPASEELDETDVYSTEDIELSPNEEASPIRRPSFRSELFNIANVRKELNWDSIRKPDETSFDDDLYKKFMEIRRTLERSDQSLFNVLKKSGKLEQAKVFISERLLTKVAKMNLPSEDVAVLDGSRINHEFLWNALNSINDKQFKKCEDYIIDLIKQSD
ncbi:hypothetical protein ACOME3_008164 [Neoechinorhynchus agilis]